MRSVTVIFFETKQHVLVSLCCFCPVVERDCVADKREAFRAEANCLRSVNSAKVMEGNTFQKVIRLCIKGNM